MKHFDILLVENDEVDALLIKDLFLEKNIHAVLKFAKNDIEALTILKEGCKIATAPKILFIDINNEKLNGLHLLNQIRKHPDLKSTLVFVLTASDNEANKKLALSYNIAAYIRKPLNTEKKSEVFAILHEYLNIIEFSRVNIQL
ncbi:MULTISPECIES: response regulator [unclassified Flavobacterium]|uniref:response regulator n=1 Tax=unclassified Flavobacterium TaxID=196869 RepID=UPI003F915282